MGSGEALVGPEMQNARDGQPSSPDLTQAVPVEAVALAASLQLRAASCPLAVPPTLPRFVYRRIFEEA
jgi:hypothetical protein